MCRKTAYEHKITRMGETAGEYHWGKPQEKTAPGATRTRDLRFRKPPLYPTELRAQLALFNGFMYSVMC